MSRPLHRLPLAAVQIATVATLMRSVALDRWITVVACLVLLGASAAAVRGRTWGVALAFTLGVTFASLWALGVAPGWFVVLGLLAIRPFTRMFRHFVAFDRSAAVVLASGAALLGAGIAAAWKSFAVDLFAAFPTLTPSIEPNHGVLVAAIGAAAAFAAVKQARSRAKEPAAETSASRVRIADGAAEDPVADAEALEERESEPELQRLVAR